jgi:hypothetical protein
VGRYHIILLLAPFIIVQRVLEGQKYVTISLLPYLIGQVRTGLEKEVETMATHAANGVPQPLAVLAEVLLHNFYLHWGNGEEGTVFTENDTPGLRNRQKGLPKYALLAAALDPRCVYIKRSTTSRSRTILVKVKGGAACASGPPAAPQQEPQPIQRARRPGSQRRGRGSVRWDGEWE